MTVQCAWCKKHMGEIEPLESSAVSHGICPKCLSEQMTVAKKVVPMKNAPKKGSPEAYAWARRMKAARSNPTRRETVKWSVHAGGTSAPEGKYGYTWYPELGEYHIDVVTTPTGRFVGYRVMFANTKGAVSGGLWHGPLYQASFRTVHAAKAAAVRHYHSITDKKNPGAAYHAAEAEQAEAQERRAARGGKVSQAAFQRGKASAHRQSEMKARELKLNPIAVFGNPGSRVQAKIEGVIYSRCIEIRAEKTHHKPGLYRHPFNKKSRAVIFGLDNGSILIQSMNGTRLWGEDSDL